MKKVILLLSALFLASPFFAQQIPNAPYAWDQAIAIFAENTTSDEINAILEDYNMEIVIGPTPNIKAYLLQFINGQWPAWASSNPIDPINGVIEKAETDSKVDGIGLNHYLIDPPHFSPPPGTKPNGKKCYQILDKDNSVNGGENAKGGIFDTGITTNPQVYLPFFDDKFAGHNYISPNTRPTDDHDHGTHVSSIVMENLDNANQNISLRAYKTHNKEGTGEAFDIIQALDQSITEGEQVVNMSFSFVESYDHKRNLKAPVRIAIEVAKDMAGILCIAAAGNSDSDNDGEGKIGEHGTAAFPASYTNENIISVASVNCRKQRSKFSNFGRISVDITAPGEGIWGFDKDGNYIAISGTSQSTAFVTKVALYLASFQENFDWDLTKCAILSGAELMNGEAYVLTNGYLDADGALAVLNSSDPCIFNPADQSKRLVAPSGPENVRCLLRDGQPYFEFTSAENRMVNVQIVNAMGNVILTEQIALNKGKTIHQFNLPTSSSLGIYFMHASGLNGRKSVKFVY